MVRKKSENPPKSSPPRSTVYPPLVPAPGPAPPPAPVPPRAFPLQLVDQPADDPVPDLDRETRRTAVEVAAVVASPHLVEPVDRGLVLLLAVLHHAREARTERSRHASIRRPTIV